MVTGCPLIPKTGTASTDEWGPQNRSGVESTSEEVPESPVVPSLCTQTAELGIPSGTAMGMLGHGLFLYSPLAFSMCLTNRVQDEYTELLLICMFCALTDLRILTINYFYLLGDFYQPPATTRVFLGPCRQKCFLAGGAPLYLLEETQCRPSAHS